MTDFDVASPVAAFDGAAAGYDETFTETRVGRALRGLLWRRLEERFSAGDRVLELNCGTGEDACWLAARGVRVLATDGSPAMLDRAERKARARRRAAEIRFRALDLDEPGDPFDPSSFDGALSSFGGLNCVASAAPIAKALSRWLRPGAPVVLVVMGPVGLWPCVSRLSRLELRAALRALGRDGGGLRPFRRGGTGLVAERSIAVLYPRPGELARAFHPFFRVERLWGLGLAVPPAPGPRAVARSPRLVAALASVERAFHGLLQLWPFPYLADHYVLELRRTT